MGMAAAASPAAAMPTTQYVDNSLFYNIFFYSEPQSIHLSHPTDWTLSCPLLDADS